jgi:hypothetical protein
MTSMPRLQKTTLLLLTRIPKASLHPRPTPRPLQSSTMTRLILILILILTLILTLTLTLTLQPSPLLLLVRVVIPSPQTREPTRIALPTPPTITSAHFHLLHSSIPPPPCPSVQTVRNMRHLPRSPVMQVSTILCLWMNPASTIPSIQAIAPRVPPPSHLLQLPGSVQSLTVHVSQ